MEGVMRKGAWTKEEDSILTHHVTIQGQGHWNSLALSAGLKRSGKSCRLRWMNYLRSDVKRGNISLHEQFLILHLHSLFGNRWSKIAQYLLGRTDNDIKNYWRTRVQKQAKQLNCDVNSQQFRDAMRNFLIPRLAEQIHQSSSSFSQDEYIVPPNASNNINLLESVVEPSNTTTSSNSSTVPDHQAAHSMPIINHEQVFRNSNSSASNKLDGLQAMDPQSPKRDVAHDDPSSSGFVYVQHSLVASDTYWSNWSGNIEEEIFLNIWADDLNFN